MRVEEARVAFFDDRDFDRFDFFRTLWENGDRREKRF
jgi:hypothetical protein